MPSKKKTTSTKLYDTHRKKQQREFKSPEHKLRRFEEQKERTIRLQDFDRRKL